MLRRPPTPGLRNFWSYAGNFCFIVDPDTPDPDTRDADTRDPDTRDRDYAAADAAFAATALEPALFLLPAGLPRFFASTIHDGGRPRRRPRPRARRSRLKIASSNCSRSWRNSSRIFATSIDWLLLSVPGFHSHTAFPFYIQNMWV